MEIPDNLQRVYFHRGWYRFLENVIYNITGLELLNGYCSACRRGVYIICSIDYYNESVDVEYIGSSQNIQKRLWSSKHEVFDELVEKQDHINYQVFVSYIDTTRYREVEKILIQSLRPKRNKVYNKGKKHGS